MNFYNQNILYTEQFDRESIEKVLDTAKEMSEIAFNKEKSDLLKGKILASLFYEASTRTRLSFETAMLRLGGDVLAVPDIETSSLAKGESLADTAKTIEQFADVIAVRHPRKGSAEEMALACEPPVINAGDGPNQHPTQALLDMYTIRDEAGKIDGIIFIRARGNIAEGLGIEHFPAPDGGPADFARAGTAIQAGDTDTGNGRRFYPGFG